MSQVVGGCSCPSLTDVAEQHWQEEQSMQGRPDKETHVHPKIVDIKDQRTGKDKGKHSQELGHRNTTDHLWKEKAS